MASVGGFARESFPLDEEGNRRFSSLKELKSFGPRKDKESNKQCQDKELREMENKEVKPQVRFRPYADSRPIPYEGIVLQRDVVFLVRSLHHDLENVAAGAPVIETFSYTGMLESRDGDRFQLSYFSMTTSCPSVRGKNILADPGGACRQDMVLDESMTFWKMGELYIEGA